MLRGGSGARKKPDSWTMYSVLTKHQVIKVIDTSKVIVIQWRT